MPPSLSRSPRRVPPRPGHGPRPVAAAPANPALRILVAGVDRDARGPIEAAVRRVFASRPPEEPWSVSLVRLPGRWSVTLSGPGEAFRNLSFTAEEQELARTIGEAIGGGDRAHPASSPGADSPAASPVEERHACERCAGTFVVLFESRPGEARERAPVACPHCWEINHVTIGAWAVVGGDYRAEKG